MNDEELAGAWTALEPTPRQRRRIEARIRGWLEARETSLPAEWLGLLRVSPLAGLGFAAMAACLVLFATPLSGLALALL
jgi:hypothetical protein